jgi:hypothetical protein
MAADGTAPNLHRLLRRLSPSVRARERQRIRRELRRWRVRRSQLYAHRQTRSGSTGPSVRLQGDHHRALQAAEGGMGPMGRDLVYLMERDLSAI